MNIVYITVAEAAKDQGLSRVTIHKYISQGRLKAVFDKVQGKYLIDFQSLKEFEKSRYIDLSPKVADE